MRCLDGLDHVLIAANNLGATARQFERLGFRITPRGRHQGWPTGNHCVMFPEDYLELLGRLDDGDIPPALGHALARGDGLMGLALTSTDPDGTYKAWRQYDLDPAPPAELSRELEGAAEALRFKNVMLETSKTAGVPVFGCHHLTPALLRPASLLEHPNGAVGIKGCTIVADDPAPVSEAFRAVFGSAAHSGTDQVAAFQTGDAAIIVAHVEDAAVMHPAFQFEEEMPEPRPMVLSIAVEEIGRTASLLDKAEIPFKTLLDETLAVTADHAAGVMLEFVPRH